MDEPWMTNPLEELVMVEVGTAAADFTVHVLTAVPQVQVITIDPWFEDPSHGGTVAVVHWGFHTGDIFGGKSWTDANRCASESKKWIKKIQ